MILEGGREGGEIDREREAASPPTPSPQPPPPAGAQTGEHTQPLDVGRTPQASEPQGGARDANVNKTLEKQLGRYRVERARMKGRASPGHSHHQCEGRERAGGTACPSGPPPAAAAVVAVQLGKVIKITFTHSCAFREPAFQRSPFGWKRLEPGPEESSWQACSFISHMCPDRESIWWSPGSCLCNRRSEELISKEGVGGHPAGGGEGRPGLLGGFPALPFSNCLCVSEPHSPPMKTVISTVKNCERDCDRAEQAQQVRAASSTMDGSFPLCCELE